MKKNLLILLSAFSSGALFCQEIPSGYNELIRVADSLYHIKDYKNSAIVYSSAFKTMSWKGTEHDRYKAACSWALANIPDSAFFSLQRITDNLYFDKYDKIIIEKDFNSLHDDKRWLPLLTKIKENKLPTGWVRRETKPMTYKIFMAEGEGQTGGKAGIVKSIGEQRGGFGNLMQSFSSEKYRGKRIRMSGYMKSENITEWASFWLRVDKKDSKDYLSFDNMHDGNTDRSIKGTTPWKKYEIVLDVPDNASNIYFGAMVIGSGQIWFEKMNFKVVDKSIPTTGRIKDEPNLDFNK